MALYHQNEDGNFVTTCLAGGIRYNLDRFILEAIEIEEAKNDANTNVMNSRSEWGERDSPGLLSPSRTSSFLVSITYFSKFRCKYDY